MPSKLRELTAGKLLNLYQALRRHFGDRHWWPGETPFEVMVGAILTQNTSWTNVEKAIRNLKSKKLLTPIALKKVTPSRLAREIRPAGYFNVKTRRLKNFIHFLWDRYQGDPLKLRETPLATLRTELLQVNGVGKETADSILLYAVSRRSFVVDAYTRRVMKRHRYLKGDEDYEAVQKIFTDRLPRKTALYNDYHAQIVEVGKNYCRKTPLCSECPLERFL